MDKDGLRRALRLYLIADTGVVPPAALPRSVEAALRGGVTIVQLRAKELTTREMLDLARELVALCHAAGVPFVVNDRVDVALACGADGAHVGHIGQEDLPPDDARRLLGPRSIVGVSLATTREVEDAERLGVSYVSAGPMYTTRTKGDAGPAVGPALLRELRPATDLPLVAIGGITADRVAELLTAGADGVCVASAVLGTADPEAAARGFIANMEVRA